MLKHGILGLLNYHDMTGYEIMGVFRDSLSFFWSAQTSQIYRELQGIEKRKWVSKTVVSQQGRPDKNVYTITKEGREELLRWLAEGALELNSKSSILMKVFFMGERNREENIESFKKLQELCKQFLRGLESVPEYIEAYSGCIDDKDKAVYWQMTVEFGQRNMKMYIDWTQSCMERLERMDAAVENA